MKAWATFIKERFPLSSHLPMIISFTLANVCVGFDDNQKLRALVLYLLMSVVLTVSFFFRLRLFDEIKDYEIDKQINPTRPLASGLISIPNVKLVFTLLILFELGATLFLGLKIFLVQLVAVGYSLLMYKEFFIGSLIRPHLTLYAVMHTAVSVLIGFCIQAQVLKFSFFDFNICLLLFGLINWCMFNIFEFTRKTFISEEESLHQDSYSKIFGLNGALLLTICQGVAAIILLYFVTNDAMITGIEGSILFIFILVSIALLIKKQGKLFRFFWGIYLVLFYIILICFYI